MIIDQKNIKKTIKISGNVLMVLSLLFVFKAIYNAGIPVSLITGIPGLFAYFIIGTTWCVLWVFIMAFAWKRILDSLSQKTSRFSEASKVYAKANLGKYLPGNVMHYVERNLFAAGLGLDQTEVALSTILEIIGMVISTFLLSVIFSFSDMLSVVQQVSTQVLTVLIILVIITISITVVILFRKPKKIRTAIKKIHNKRFICVYLSNIIIYSISFIVFGIILVYLVSLMEQEKLTLYEIRSIISTYVIAYLSGFIIPGAPGGIGVREFVISFLSKGTSYNDSIIVAAIIHRVMSITGDVLAYIIPKK